MLRAIAHPQRRAILRLVSQSPRSAGELAAACGLSGPAASQHLNLLRLAGLVKVRPEGARRIYSVDFEALQSVRTFLDELWNERLGALKAGLETEQREVDCREAG